ncbi:unnamed protein product [Meloidogyne enterolobii]|uniref:Uncharacterized protein n=1 Tax=Meloidogyne enterolobii TaxID=390850 RepID=A0ACB0XRI4_MELEN
MLKSCSPRSNPFFQSSPLYLKLLSDLCDSLCNQNQGEEYLLPESSKRRTHRELNRHWRINMLYRNNGHSDEWHARCYWPAPQYRRSDVCHN